LRKQQSINLSKLPDSDVLCHCWKGVIAYKKALSQSTIYYPATDNPASLLDMTQMTPLNKQVAELNEQGPYESRRIWNPVTQAIQDGRFSEATTEKRRIEDEQRQKERERRANGDRWESFWFAFSHKLKKNHSRTQSPALLGLSPSVHRRAESSNSYQAGGEEEYAIKGGADDPMEDDEEYGCGLEGKPFLRRARQNDLPWKND
jgi:hypothetical protein